MVTLRERPAATRTIVAIAGAPGSGKSTLAAQLEAALHADGSDRATTLPMDGFHYDDSVLSAMERLPFKGAPDTFDARGLAWTLHRLRASESEVVAVPVFDRGLEIARAGARLINQADRIVLVEGNYLLCRGSPWGDLATYFDLTVMIEVPEATLRQRLRERWVHFGLDEDGIRHKLDANDIPNGQYVHRTSRPADFVLTPDSDPPTPDPQASTYQTLAKGRVSV